MHVQSGIPRVHAWPKPSLRRSSMSSATLSNLGGCIDSLGIPAPMPSANKTLLGMLIQMLMTITSFQIPPLVGVPSHQVGMVPKSGKLAMRR